MKDLIALLLLADEESTEEPAELFPINIITVIFIKVLENLVYGLVIGDSFHAHVHADPLDECSQFFSPEMPA